jgi:hypothetical protein
MWDAVSALDCKATKNSARPVTTENGNPHVPDTSLEPYCDNEPTLQDMNKEINTQDL